MALVFHMNHHQPARKPRRPSTRDSDEFLLDGPQLKTFGSNVIGQTDFTTTNMAATSATSSKQKKSSKKTTVIYEYYISLQNKFIGFHDTLLLNASLSLLNGSSILIVSLLVATLRYT